MSLSELKFFTLNIGGQLHRISGARLLQFPETLLGRLACSDENEAAKLCDQFLIDSKEFFFDRSPHAFKAIADFYRTGKFHVPADPCEKQAALDELQYWQIPTFYVSECCKIRVGVQRKKMMKGMSKKTRGVADSSPGAVGGPLTNSSTASVPLLKRSISSRLGFSSRKLGFLLSEVEPEYGDEEQRFKHAKMLTWVNIENPGVTWYSLVLFRFSKFLFQEI